MNCLKPAEIEKIVEPFLAKKSKINLVVGLMAGNTDIIMGFGDFSESSSVKPDGKTLFEIGSITKVFTTTLLSSLVNRRELHLDTSVASLISKYKNLPEYITLESLATHTSGLPRIPDNLLKSARQNMANPYAAYSQVDLDEYLASYDGKSSKTVGKISYSNLGMGLLGYILAQHLNLDYEEAIKTFIRNPLELSDTSITLTEEQKARLAIGRSAKGKPVSNWDIPTLGGAGALKSHGEDMLKFLRANLQPSQTNLGEAIIEGQQMRCTEFPTPPTISKILSQISRFFPNQTKVKTEIKGIALGWFISDLKSVEKQVYWHNGGTGGYRCFCGFVKETDTAVVVLANYADGILNQLRGYSVDTLGMQILEKMNSIETF